MWTKFLSENKINQIVLSHLTISEKYRKFLLPVFFYYIWLVDYFEKTAGKDFASRRGKNIIWKTKFSGEI
jgi:hypothetical protein